MTGDNEVASLNLIQDQSELDDDVIFCPYGMDSNSNTALDDNKDSLEVVEESMNDPDPKDKAKAEEDVTPLEQPLAEALQAKSTAADHELEEQASLAAVDNDNKEQDVSEEEEATEPGEIVSETQTQEKYGSRFFLCGLCKRNPVAVGSSPKLLPCLHSFCQSCLQERFDQHQTTVDSNGNPVISPRSRLKCPSCGQEFLVNNDISGFLNNQFIIESTMDSKTEDKEKVCTSCDDKSKATCFCLNCSEWLCEACTQAHQRVKVTKDHIIRSQEEFEATLSASEENFTSGRKPLFCKLHPQEQLKLFCATCDKLTCRDCQLVEHKDHRYQFINEAATKHRDVLRKLIQYLKVNLGLLKETISDVENVGTGLEQKEKDIEVEIRKSVEALVKALKHREKVLIAELQGLVQSKLGLLAKQKKDLTQMRAILEHNHDFAKYAVDHGSDVSLLYCRKVLGTRLHNLNSLKYRQRPLAFNDLKFAIDVEKLCGYLARTGTVYSQEDLQRRLDQFGSKSSGASTASSGQTSNSVARPRIGNPSHSQVNIPPKLTPIEALSAVNKRISDSSATPSSTTQFIALSSGKPTAFEIRGQMGSQHSSSKPGSLNSHSSGFKTTPVPSSPHYSKYYGANTGGSHGNTTNHGGRAPEIVVIPSSKPTTASTINKEKLELAQKYLQQIQQKQTHGNGHFSGPVTKVTEPHVAAQNGMGYVLARPSSASRVDIGKGMTTLAGSGQYTRRVSGNSSSSPDGNSVHHSYSEYSRARSSASDPGPSVSSPRLLNQHIRVKQENIELSPNGYLLSHQMPAREHMMVSSN